MMVNRCRSFITMKMRKRMQMRQIKDSKKELKKKRIMLSNQLAEQLKQQLQQAQQKEEDPEVTPPEPKPQQVVVESGDTGKSEPIFDVQKQVPSTPGGDSTGSDDVLLTINKEQRKLKKRRKNKSPKSETEASEKRRIRFDLKNN